MADSTTAEKWEVANHAEVSRQHLYDLAAERRNASAELAGRIETAIRAVNRRKREQPLPVVGRGDISSACANCSFYKKECK